MDYTEAQLKGVIVIVHEDPEESEDKFLRLAQERQEHAY